MSLWEEMRANNEIMYGLRPLEGYGYFETRFGHLSDGRPVGTALVRWRYDPFLLRSSVDEQVSFFLPFDSAFTLGSSYELINLRSHTSGLNLSATLTRTFGKKWYEGALSIGVTKNDHDTLATIDINHQF